MAVRPEFLTFDVGDTELGALRWAGISGAPTIVAIHGITSTAWAWDPVAHHLAGAAHLVALDLRGRGRSLDAPGPFGISRHADDVARVVEQIGEPGLVVGHSMGASVALLAADRHWNRIKDVVLVDGGPPVPLPDGLDAVSNLDDVDTALTAVMGPAYNRLHRTWADRTSYYSMWAAHPAFAGGISIDVERNLLSDLMEVDGGFRPAISTTAVRADGLDVYTNSDVRSLLARRTVSTRILRAPNGRSGGPPPVISEEAVAATPRHRWTTVPDTNHYTLVIGAAGAAAVAQALRDELTGA